VASWSSAPAAGWGGDRFLSFGREGKSLALWLTDWDSPEDAEEFEASLQKVRGSLPAPREEEEHRIVRKGTAVVLIARAPRALSDEMLSHVWTCRRRRDAETAPYGKE